VARRYEHGSVILTANKSYGEWAEVFSGDAVIATTILDRLLHHSTTISIKGESYRLKDRKKAGLTTLPVDTLRGSVFDRHEGVNFGPSLTQLLLSAYHDSTRLRRRGRQSVIAAVESRVVRVVLAAGSTPPAGGPGHRPGATILRSTPESLA